MPPMSGSDSSEPPDGGLRPLWLALGWLSFEIGMVGAVLPLLPTTVFLILAAGCFARGSPRLEGWLLSHPRFGPSLQAWRERGAIAQGAKLMACVGMASSYAMFGWAFRPSMTVALVVAFALTVCAVFVLSRPPLE